MTLGNYGNLHKIIIIGFHADHILHVLLFIPWAFFSVKMNKHLPLYFILGLLCAVGSEGLQYFLQHRSFNISDMFANTIGVLSGFCIFVILLKLDILTAEKKLSA